MRRVVVTGLGAVTPLGSSAEESWSNLCKGRSGVRPITRFDASGLRTRVAGQAVQDARLTIGGGQAGARVGARPERVAVTMGNTFAGVLQLEQGVERIGADGATALSPFFIPGFIGNMAAGVAAMALGAKGANLTVSQACASGAAAIGLGLRLLRAGEADVVVAGGCEAALSRVIFCGYHTLKATSARNDAPERASRPFDRERDGFVPAEGAAAVVLEPYDRAARRDAPMLAELAGYGTTCDAFHLTRPDPSADGCTRCMQLALADAGLVSEDVDHVNAHG